MQHVTNLMDPIDILDLSLCSKKARKCSLMYRARPTHCNLITRTTFDKKVGVEIVFSEYVKLTWMFLKDFARKKVFPGEVITARKVEGTVFETSCKCATTNSMLTFCVPLESSLQTVTSYLLYLFPCPVQSFELDINFFSDLSFFTEWTMVKRCEKLILRARNASKAKVEEVLEIVNGFKKLELIGYKGDEIDTNKVTELNELKVKDAHWLSGNKLLGLNCEKIEIEENKYSPKTLNKFIKKWLDKGFESLEFLSVHMGHIPVGDIHRLFNGIRLDQWNPNLRHGYFRKDSETVYDCRTGRDIIRDDGKFATVTFTNCTFNFMVWHTTQPDFTLPRGMFFAKNPKYPILVAKCLSPTTFQTNEEIEREFEFFV